MLDANANIPEPMPPGPWVDDVACICGAHRETYKKFNSGVTFAEASQELRDRNKLREVYEDPQLYVFEAGSKDEAPGGFRSRRSVLWMMHVMKMEAWYAKHESCPNGNWDWDEFCENWPDSYSCAGYEAWVAAGRPEPGEDPDLDQAVGDAAEEWEEDEVPF